MSKQDPVLEKIGEKEEAIRADVQLIKKKNKKNKLAIAPLLVMLLGILVGVLRILLKII
ncbi:hypothetical protein [Enterococcus mundtii]|uniref:Uncharacterized protein n=1 Tax=Enterococcus mundtii TaxID=53346 RepID=A0A242KUC7_ENTMU|nr:hypothetical protein [Enterococcus mundtii]OTP24835.1 hypothetical protein A5802_002990 [Enterococcus mundtii]